MDSQSQSWDSGEFHQFPAGLRVLVVDDDATCLKIIDRMLKKCQYSVTTCSRAVVALEILRENKEGFDIVLSDVHMPDMDGFKLLVHIGLEMDLPVINDGKDVVMKGVTHGACDYLIKPVSMKALQNIWQHVFRKKSNELKEMDNSGSLDDSDKQKKPLDEGDSASSGSWKATKRKKVGEEDDELEEREDSSMLKKSRVVWSVDLHQQFVAAVNQLGLEKAVPKKILELMNDPTLTRENVASHLQKYRLYLKRLSVPQHQGRTDTFFSSPPDISANQVSSFDLQALAASGQIPQSLVNLHPVVSRRVANISMGMPTLKQRGFFNSEGGPTMVQKLSNNQMPLHSIPRLASNVSMGMPNSDRRVFFNSDAQLANSSYTRTPMMQQMNNNQMSGFYESSTSMEPRHLGQAQVFPVSDGIQELMNSPSSLRASSTFPGGSGGRLTNPFVTQMNLQGQLISLAQQGHMQSGVQQPPQSRAQLLNGISTGRQMVSNGITNHVLERNGTEVNGGASLQGNYTTMSRCGTFPQSLSSNVQNSNTSKSNCHSHVNSMLVVPGGLATLGNVAGLTCDMFSDFYQSKNEGWNLQDRNHSYETKQSNVDYDFSLRAHQDSNAILEDGTIINSCTVGKEISHGVEIKHETVECVSQDLLFSDDSFPNELMSVIKR